MRKSVIRNIRLGFLVIFGIMIFTVAIYYLGSKEGLFTQTITIKSHFKNVNGLVEGNNVRFSGIDVGIVSDIWILSDSIVVVEIDIDKKVKKFIRKDSKVEIGSKGLMGSKIVNIYPGSEMAGGIESGDVLQSMKTYDIEQVYNEVKNIIAEVKQITTSIKGITHKIDHGEGDLALLLNQDNITRALLKSTSEIDKVSKNLNSITYKINSGKGDIGRLINDTTLTHQLNNAIADINEITTRSDSLSIELLNFGEALNNGPGVLPTLVYDRSMTEEMDTLLDKADAGINELISTSRKVNDSWILNLFSKDKKK